tara:strand:- start:161 stop:580 length:420 start_codon:yes stop_codon:yes gene_type:complete
MGDVLEIVHRLRKAEEHRARAVLADAQVAYEQCQTRLHETEQALHQTMTSAANGVIDLQARHQGALRLELERRYREQQMQESLDRAGSARETVTEHAKAAKVVELVATSRRDEAMAEHQRRTRQAFDEQGLQSWWRRSA